jgi:glycosyltransferase involved in cell wall biosynthesis
MHEIIKPKVIVASFNSWHMDHSANVYQTKNALVGIYSSIKNSKGIATNLYHRCWLFHFIMKPFYHILDPLAWQQIQYRFFMPVFNIWLKVQKYDQFNVVQAIAWGAKAPFDLAEKHGALKVLDAPNSYPTTYDGYERREMAIWGKKVKPSVPEHIIEQVVRDIERADVILCPSKWVFDSMIANGVDSKKCKINPFGVNVDIFKPRESIPKVPRFVCVGSITLRKGHQYLFPAFNRIKQKYPDAELYCLGAVLSDFKHIWKQWKDLVTFQGHMSHFELAALYQRSTAFVLPSVEEGFARAIIEAMSSGVAILATYESGATTLVENGKEGIIFQTRNVDAIYNAMKVMIENPQLAHKMGELAAIRGGLNNTWEDYGTRNLLIFEEFLNSNKSKCVDCV